MKYCSHCGKQIMDEAVICVHCGCPVDNTVRPQVKPPENPKELLNTLSQRVQIGGILWIIIGSFQVLYALILLFLFFDWFAAVIGVIGILNIVTSVKDFQYSKTVLDNPNGIVEKYEPLGDPIATLIWNSICFFAGCLALDILGILIGLIGVGGSIYDLIGVRGFVMSKREAFAAMNPSRRSFGNPIFSDKSRRYDPTASDDPNRANSPSGNPGRPNPPRVDAPANSWTCPSCGRVNAAYVGTCACGRRKNS